MYKLTATQEIGVTAEIDAVNREQAIERFTSFLHGWINRANEERTTANKQHPAYALIEVEENEGGGTIFDQADPSGQPIVKGA